MRVVGAILLALCMLVVAGLAGATAYFYLDVGMLEAATVAVAAFALLALYHTVSSRLGLRSTVSRQLTDLSRGGADIARQVAEIGRRLAALESRCETALDDARSVIDPLNIQLSELDTRVRRLAQTLGMHQATIDPVASVAEQPVRTALSPAPRLVESPDSGVGPTHPAMLKEISVETIRSAVKGNRVDLYLQPIVTLPRRKVRFYEAMSRLRSDTGESVPQSRFVPPAERAGLMPAIDYLVIFRCVQIVRRLLMKNRDIGVLCSVSRKTLADPALAQQVYDFMAANRAIASSLILQFSQSTMRKMNESEYEKLAALAALGFRFCLNEATTLRLEPEELAPRGFRYVKLHTPLLLGAATPAEPRPGELSELLARFGIDLVVDEIDDESSVMELLDHDVRYGQGLLFSAPRPVRADALQATPAMPDGVAEALSAPVHAAVNGVPPPAGSLPSAAEPGETGSHAELSRGALRLGQAT